ncbi:MAG: hypothetical protein V7744_08205 [Pseudomonadales bacterium]
MKRKARPTQQRNIEFLIERIDGLGQGVTKSTAGTCFIPKTLPGETGTARIHKTSKGVSFANAISIDTAAPNRIEAECEHFADCPGCHFLHTGYDSELKYKHAALTNLLRDLPVKPEQIAVEPAPDRLHYRNRIQLHYRHKYIGMIDGDNDQILEIPNCKIIATELQPAFDALYADKEWSKTHTGGGHCEIYYTEGELRTSWNQPYAQGGFTQINEAMNSTLCEQLIAYANKGPITTILDLFSGNGNLSEALLKDTESQRTMVDSYSDPQNTPSNNFHNLDLFDPSSLKSFVRKHPDSKFDLLIVDPPRKGFPALSDWVQKYQPQQLIYVSCNAATMARDLKALEGSFVISDACLMDLFPATHHYETIVRVEFKNHKKKRPAKDKRLRW